MVIARLKQRFEELERLRVLAAEGHVGLVAVGQFIAGAGPAHGVEVAPQAAQLALVVERIGDEPPVFLDHALGHGQNGQRLRQYGQHRLQKPVHAKAGNAADHGVRALQRFGKLLELIVLVTLRQLPAHVQVPARLAGMLDDLAVERRADQPHLVAVFAGGDADGRAHHARADDGDDRHRKASFFFCLCKQRLRGAGAAQCQIIQILKTNLSSNRNVPSRKV